MRVDLAHTSTVCACPHPSVDLLEFDGVKIGFEKKLKIVGVMYDCKPNWSKMTSEMANRGKQALGFSRRDLVASSLLLIWPFTNVSFDLGWNMVVLCILHLLLVG